MQPFRWRPLHSALVRLLQGEKRARQESVRYRPPWCSIPGSCPPHRARAQGSPGGHRHTQGLYLPEEGANAPRGSLDPRRRPLLLESRRALIEQQRRQLPPRLDQIGQCVRIQLRKERLGGVAQYAAQHADTLDRAIATLRQAADNFDLLVSRTTWPTLMSRGRRR